MIVAYCVDDHRVTEHYVDQSLHLVVNDVRIIAVICCPRCQPAAGANDVLVTGFIVVRVHCKTQQHQCLYKVPFSCHVH